MTKIFFLSLHLCQNNVIKATNIIIFIIPFENFRQPLLSSISTKSPTDFTFEQSFVAVQFDIYLLYNIQRKRRRRKVVLNHTKISRCYLKCPNFWILFLFVSSTFFLFDILVLIVIVFEAHTNDFYINAYCINKYISIIISTHLQDITIYTHVVCV